jgi:hypothetical protein
MLLTGLHPTGRLLALPTNVRLGQNLLKVINTQAYYGVDLITGVKSFTEKAPNLKC